jgi:hypothetical protein
MDGRELRASICRPKKSLRERTLFGESTGIEFPKGGSGSLPFPSYVQPLPCLECVRCTVHWVLQAHLLVRPLRHLRHFRGVLSSVCLHIFGFSSQRDRTVRSPILRKALRNHSICLAFLLYGVSPPWDCRSPPRLFPQSRCLSAPNAPAGRPSRCMLFPQSGSSVGRGHLHNVGFPPFPAVCRISAAVAYHPPGSMRRELNVSINHRHARLERSGGAAIRCTVESTYSTAQDGTVSGGRSRPPQPIVLPL